MKKVIPTVILCFALFVVNQLTAAQRSNMSEQDRSTIHKIYDRIEMMRHELGNHEVELRVFHDKLRNMEDAIESLREQFDKSMLSQQEKLRGSETKLFSQERSMQGVVSDLEKLQNHANDSSSVLEQYQKQIATMDAVIQSQAKNIEDLKVAMKSLMGALSDSEGTGTGNKIHRVQPGDSLGVIALKYGTTVQEIKKINHLKSDTIIVGQKLKVPEK